MLQVILKICIYLQNGSFYGLFSTAQHIKVVASTNVVAASLKVFVCDVKLGVFYACTLSQLLVPS